MINLIDGIDAIDVSTGGVVNDVKIDIYPGYQVNYTEIIKNKTGIKTIAGGLITNLEMCKSIINSNQADLVFLGRKLLRNPYFVLNSDEEKEWPKPYLRAKK